VEVTAACNLRCRMCIVRYQPQLPRSASMTVARLRRLLDQLPSVREVVLQGIGEPLLAPDIYEMVAEASRRGLFVEFNSNATLLTRRAGERLIEAGLSALHLSLDGARAETYEFVRDGARWETVTANIAGFMELLRERGAARPAVSLVTVLMRRTLPDLAGVVELAGRWGIGEVFVQNLSHDFSDAPRAAYDAIAAYVDEQSVRDLPAVEVEAAFARARSAAEQHGVTLRLPRLEEPPRPALVDGVAVGCDWPFTGAYVTYTGTLMPCCMVMGNDRVALGDVDARPFVEVWEDAPARDFRAGLLTGDPHAVCRGCSLYRGVF
jgi:MoaA/NifB/PqqE/SkfB family radical SAM enzyme